MVVVWFRDNFYYTDNQWYIYIEICRPVIRSARGTGKQNWPRKQTLCFPLLMLLSCGWSTYLFATTRKLWLSTDALAAMKTFTTTSYVNFSFLYLYVIQKSKQKCLSSTSTQAWCFNLLPFFIHIQKAYFLHKARIWSDWDDRVRGTIVRMLAPMTNATCVWSNVSK